MNRKTDRITKKELALRMYRKGMSVDAIAEVLHSDPSYVANALIEQGFAPEYMDLYTTTGPQNRYAALLAGVLKFKDVEAARESVRRLEALHRHFREQRDRRGMHQCEVLALTGKNRAEGIGKLEEARVFAEWLRSHLTVSEPRQRERTSVGTDGEPEPAEPLALAA
jgi:hypothetical protein